jgi:FkbM family methyltransferase
MLKSIGRRFSNLTEWRRIIGARSLLRLRLSLLCEKFGVKGPEFWRVRPRQVHHEVIARLRGCSDLTVFYQIFIQEEYASLRDLKEVSLVLDLGANVGYSTTWFLNCFPCSRVLAVEPDERNLVVSKVNLKPYGERARLLHGAVWSESTSLSVISKGALGSGLEWSTQVMQPEDGSAGDVPAWDVGSLIDMAGTKEADLLKVDIEGAERTVFDETSREWLPRVRNICIELHGPECEKTFFLALADFDYTVEHAGELTICKNLRLKASME